VIWRSGNKASPLGAALADRHYSRRKVGSPQFMPPGETIVLISNCGRAVWGGLSSTLILEAELALQDSGRGCKILFWKPFDLAGVPRRRPPHTLERTPFEYRIAEDS
jgi:hypothetical protein